jgi:nitrate reductase NapE component
VTQDEQSPGTSPATPSEESPEKRRLAQETKNERQVWYFLAYFLFGIHFVAFVMIYAVRHAK